MRNRFCRTEIEAIATDTLLALEQEGQRVVLLCKGREADLRIAKAFVALGGGRASGLPTLAIVLPAIKLLSCRPLRRLAICIIKPVMSSSGKGQSFIRDSSTLDKAWDLPNRAVAPEPGRVIVEGVVKFDFRNYPS